MRLKTKLAVFSGLLVFVALVIIAFLLLFFEKQFLLKTIKENQKNVSSNFVSVCSESIINEDDLLLVNYLDSLKKDSSIKYAVFLDKKNKIIAHTQTRLVGGFANASVRDENVIETTAPVAIGEKGFGTAKIGFSKLMIEKTVKQSLDLMLNRIIAASVIVFVIGVIISVFFVNMVNKDILQLVNGARAIGAGNLEHRIKITSKDELGELSEEFNEMAEKLKELDMMKNDFVSSITHELRTPLSAIKGYSELLLEEDLNDIIKNYTLTIRDNSVRLGNFINNILDLAKIEAGMVELDKKPGDITKIVQETLDFYKPLFNKKNIVFKSEHSGILHSINVDSDKIRQVLANLIGNAIKFTPEGGEVTIETKTVNNKAEIANSEQFTDYVEISVSDTGIGIPAEQLGKIFDKFYQVRGISAKGTGLGLSIVKGIVEAHSGRIKAISPSRKSGQGSEFIIWLPRQEIN